MRAVGSKTCSVLLLAFWLRKGWPTFFDLATHLIYTTHHSLEYASPLLYVANGHWGHCGHCGHTGHTGQCLCRIRSDEIDCVWESYCSLHSYYFMSSGALFLRGNTHGDNLEKSISNKLSHRLKWPEMKEDKWMIMVWLCFWLSDAGSQCWGLKPQSPKLAVSPAHCAVLCWLEWVLSSTTKLSFKNCFDTLQNDMAWHCMVCYGMSWCCLVCHSSTL